MVVMVGDREDGGEGVCAYNTFAWHLYAYFYGERELRNRKAGDPFCDAVGCYASRFGAVSIRGFDTRI